MRRRREEEAAEAAREEDIETALARQPGEGRGAAAEGGLAWQATATGERAEAAWRGGRGRYGARTASEEFRPGAGSGRRELRPGAGSDRCELRPARAPARAGVEGDGAGRAHGGAEEKPEEDFGVSLTTRPHQSVRK